MKNQFSRTEFLPLSASPSAWQDMPFADTAARFELMRILRELANEGKCIVAVLHDLALALEYSDYIALIHKGRLIAFDTPRALAASPMLGDVLRVSVDILPEGRYLISPK